MTNKEAIETLKRTIAYESEFAEAKALAIEALEAWDKVKEEIEVYKSSLYTDNFDFYSGNMSALSAIECILEQLLQEVEEVDDE